MNRPTGFLLKALAITLLAAVLMVLLLRLVYGLADAPVVGWFLAGGLQVGVIILAIWWQTHHSLPAFLKRASRLSLLAPLQKMRRARLLRQAFPESWLAHLRRNVATYNILSDDEQARIRDVLRVLIAEKRWEGCAGLEITDEIKVTVTAQASVLLLDMDHDYYDSVPSILMYPTGFMIPQADLGPDGVIDGVGALGQAWYRGPVILAWDRVLQEGQSLHTRSNLVYHEFAHQLDFTGVERNSFRSFRGDWQQVMTEEYQALVEASHQGTPTLLDHYGATNRHEFFAVATECFFTQSRAMLEQHPRLYEVLSHYYDQHPAARQPLAPQVVELS